MSDQNRTHSFQTPGPAKLRIELPKGRITVFAEATDTTRIELAAPHGDAEALAWIADAEVAEVAGEIVVRGRRLGLSLLGFGGSIEATVHAPTASAATLSVGAGRIETKGRLGDVTASSGAGSVRVEACGEARVRTGSGEIEVGGATGSVDAKTGAGRVTLGKVGADARVATGMGSTRVDEVAGAANVTTGSGNVEVGQAGESTEVFTASGNVDVRRADHGRVRARTVSGRVSVGVPNGVAALLDIHTLSGRVRSDLAASGAPGEGEKHVELFLSTVSGNVNVARA